MLKNENRSQSLLIHANVQKLNDFRMSSDSLEYFDLSVDLLLSDRLEYFKDDFLISFAVESVINLGVFSSS